MAEGLRPPCPCIPSEFGLRLQAEIKNGWVEWASKEDMRSGVKNFVNGFRLFVTIFRAMRQQNGI